MRILANMLRHRDSPLYDWTIAREMEGTIAMRAPSGECFRLVAIPMDPRSADAQALECTALLAKR
jgi:hypothetical protein